MAFDKFKDIQFRPATLNVIDQANTIIAEYQRRGFKLTLRQLYYQFVSRDLLPNKQSEYKRLGSILDDGRQAGLIDWSMIEDRLRNLEKLSVWSSPSSILGAVAEQYREDWWRTQDFYAEAWIEKDALTGVIERVCEEYRVPYFACRGYVSQSEMYDAAQRFKGKRKPCVILHLGDHDPSGIHMTEDIAQRLQTLSRYANIEVIRLALTMDQVDEYSPPPNPAKDTDSRFEGYSSIYGDESWELDALSPEVIEGLIRDALDDRIDPEKWTEAQEKEEQNRVGLTRVSENWVSTLRYLKYRENSVPVADYETTVDDLLIDMEANEADSEE
jgi:hypothetical protein